MSKKLSVFKSALDYLQQKNAYGTKVAQILSKIKLHILITH